MFLNDVVLLALYKRDINPNQRRGQSLYNALAELNSKMAYGITNTINDPFHDDKNIDRFYHYIINNS